MHYIEQNLIEIQQRIPKGVRLVAVSKYNPIKAIQEAYSVGQRIFGESQVQELQSKQRTLPSDIEWHFIGHLQTNKVKYIAPYISLIHAVDSLKLLQEINKQGKKNERRINCLLQIHIAQESSKFGFTLDECRAFFTEGVWKELNHAKICGLMCMASNTDEEVKIREEFHAVKLLFNELKRMYFPTDNSFCECSWGMSDDFPIAIEEGSTLIRIGSMIFGERHY